MIARLNGIVDEKTDNSVVVNVGGVGYELFVAANLLENLVLGEEASLSVYTHVREQSLELFGFRGSSEKQLFLQLIGVSGVGPKMGLAIAGLSDERSIRQAIANEDIAFLTAASGVGKRLAEKVIVDLKDKIGVMPGESSTEDSPFEALAPAHDEALEALIALGFTKHDASERLRKIKTDLSVEDRVKQALSQGL